MKKSMKEKILVWLLTVCIVTGAIGSFVSFDAKAETVSEGIYTVFDFGKADSGATVGGTGGSMDYTFGYGESSSSLRWNCNGWMYIHPANNPDWNQYDTVHVRFRGDTPATEDAPNNIDIAFLHDGTWSGKAYTNTISVTGEWQVFSIKIATLKKWGATNFGSILFELHAYTDGDSDRKSVV